MGYGGADATERIKNGANFAGLYIEMRMRRVYLSMRTEGIKGFQNGYGVVVWTGESDTKTPKNSSVLVWKRTSVDGA